MKNKKLLPFKILFFSALGLTTIALIVYMIMNSMDIKTNPTWSFVNGEIVEHSWHDGFRIVTYIYAGIIFVLLLFTIFYVFDAYKKKQEKLLLNLVVSIVSIPLMIGIVIGGGTIVTGLMIDYETNYYLLASKEYPVVVCEKYREGECKGEVFQIMENGDAKCLGSFSTENGYKDSSSYKFEEYEGGIKVYFAYSDKLRGCVESDWVVK